LCETKQGIVGTITSHSAEVTKTLEMFDNLVLVFGEDTGETISIQDHVIEGDVFAARCGSILQDHSRIHVVKLEMCASRG